MKAIVAGFVVIALSGAAVLWHRLHISDSPPADPAASVERSGERTARCMVWKAQRGKATVWLCGSFHTMRENDYPLPTPYETAFAESKIIVTEIPQGEANDLKMREQLQQSGQLSAGKRLSDVLSEKTRVALESWSQSSNVRMEKLQSMKPWMAALTITAAAEARCGYRRTLGIERHFTAKSGDRLSRSLASPQHQISFFDKLEPAFQEQMILNAIEEDGDYDLPRRLRVSAWQEGDAARLAALRVESMRSVVILEKLMFADRNAEWLPVIEQYLDGTETVMVLVGAGHLAGSGSLIELLARKGVSLTQMEYQTVRPAANR